MKEIFTDIYARNVWHGGSGPGSDPTFCAPLIAFLQEYVHEHRIGSLCDLGCGDLQWMPTLIEKVQIRYIGVDCVESLLAAHRQKHAAPLNGEFEPLKRFGPEKLFAWGGKTLYRLKGPSPLPGNL